MMGLGLLSTLSGVAASIVLYRWGFSISTPGRDVQTAARFVRRVGYTIRRRLTYLPFWPTRLVVILTDVFGIDRWRWRELRRRYAMGGYDSDYAAE